VSGELRRYRVKADSGNGTTRNFCPICETLIMVELVGDVEIGGRFLNRQGSNWD